MAALDLEGARAACSSRACSWRILIVRVSSFFRLSERWRVRQIPWCKRFSLRPVLSPLLGGVGRSTPLRATNGPYVIGESPTHALIKGIVGG